MTPATLSCNSSHLMFADPWLERWLPLVVERSQHAPVLEMGCGYGDDTVTLVNAGLNVLAFDMQPTCVAMTKMRAPKADVECRDIRTAFPQNWPKFAVIVASLSLHYFSWEQTQAIIQKIRFSLLPGGLLLCRVNATDDHNFGAGTGLQVEANFYAAQKQMKRFFDEDALERLFAKDWRVLSREHIITNKYVQAKALWELVLEKPGNE